MKKYIAQHLGTVVGVPDGVACRYSKFNNECLKEKCPFYEAEDCAAPEPRA